MPAKKQPSKKPTQKAPPKVKALSVIPKNKVGRKCSICFHIAVKEINELISKGTSFRRISSQFEFSDRSLSRHTSNCLKLDLRAFLDEKRIEYAVEHYQELIKQLDFVKALQTGVKKFLIDSNTGEVSFATRDYETKIMYRDFGDIDPFSGLPKWKEQKLSDIILSIAKHKEGFVFQGVTLKTINYFDAALKTVDAVDKLLDKFARVDGHYQKERENDETLNRVAKAFKTWREDHPEVLEEKLPLWLKRFAENSGVDFKKLADRVGIEVK